MRAGYKSKGTSSSTAVPIFFLFCGHRQRQRRLLVAGARRPLCSPHPHHIHPSTHHSLVAVGVVTEPEPPPAITPTTAPCHSIEPAALRIRVLFVAGFLMLW
jgi:hypothetical protein